MPLLLTLAKVQMRAQIPVHMRARERVQWNTSFPCVPRLRVLEAVMQTETGLGAEAWGNMKMKMEKGKALGARRP